MWSSVTTMPLPVTTCTAGTTSSSWHSSAHAYADNSNSMVDNEFDMLGTRSRSPMVVSSTACTLPSYSQLSLGMLVPRSLRSLCNCVGFSIIGILVLKFLILPANIENECAMQGWRVLNRLLTFCFHWLMPLRILWNSFKISWMIDKISAFRSCLKTYLF